jgi:hypothetical protein
VNSTRSAVAFLIMFAIVCSGYAQESVDLMMISKIKSEGFDNSQIMDIASYLTDVHGPRLTNSPNYWKASQWCVDQLTEWGLANAQLEPWGPFGRGWEVERFSMVVTEPQFMSIIAYPKAWTPGTDGVVSGNPVQVKIESEEDLNNYRGKLAGAIVLAGEPREAETHFEADAKRFSDEELSKLIEAPEPDAQSPWAARREEFRRRRALREKVNRFLKSEGVAVVLEPSEREHGTIRVHRSGSFQIGVDTGPPALVVSAEQYARLARLLDKDIPVKLEISIQARFLDDDSLGYNVIAEIPGIDKKLKTEVVMLGGHLDSWHSGTGATDNAAGCAVAMEAVRILKAVGARPRRTIRIALWGGEEQGLLGSHGYVKNHFGDRATMALKPAHGDLSAYFNLDNGSGKIRGIYLQGNDAVRPIFEAWLRPFHDLDAATVTIRTTGGTDHLAFDAVGLPGFQFIQDPLDYDTRTHHTNMDVYDHLQKGDLMQASVIMASFVYHAAMRDEKLPRKIPPKPPMSRAPTNGQ